jgi:hypothetical protein
MKCIDVAPDDLVLSSELSRSRRSKQFEERLTASIEEIGLAEPIKVAPLPDGHFLVVDGTMRVKAINAIRDAKPSSFSSIPAYVVEFEQRYEVRYQTDIYQDLLPSQLASLVEHLHKSENIAKADLAKFIGVTRPTLRNYTGLWRMVERGGLFAQVVALMDVGVVPSSNPYTWLRLNKYGIRQVIENSLVDDGDFAEPWIKRRIAQARRGDVSPYPVKFIEEVTGNLGPECYREGEEVRALKRDLGLRRAGRIRARAVEDTTEAVRHLTHVSRRSREPVIKTAAQALAGYLQ